jgi:hypothetical protein
MDSRATVHYPFHPLRGKQLEVVHTPRGEGGAVVVAVPGGHRLKIPTWMLEPRASAIVIRPEPIVSARAWLVLCDLLGIDDPGPGASGSATVSSSTQHQQRRRGRGAAAPAPGEIDG